MWWLPLAFASIILTVPASEWDAMREMDKVKALQKGIILEVKDHPGCAEVKVEGIRNGVLVRFIFTCTGIAI